MEKERLKERIEQLENVIELCSKGLWFLFLCLSVGVIATRITMHTWAFYIIGTTIICTFAMIHLIRRKMKKKKKEQEENNDTMQEMQEQN